MKILLLSLVLSLTIHAEIVTVDYHPMSYASANFIPVLLETGEKALLLVGPCIEDLFGSKTSTYLQIQEGLKADGTSQTILKGYIDPSKCKELRRDIMSSVIGDRIDLSNNAVGTKKDNYLFK